LDRRGGVLEVALGLDCDVEPWRNGAAEQAELAATREESGSARSSVASQGGAQVICEPPRLRDVDAGADREHRVSFVQVERALARVVLDQTRSDRRGAVELEPANLAVQHVARLERRE